VPRPNDHLFIAQDVYDWRLSDEVGISAYYVGRYGEAKAACEAVLARAEQGVAVPAADVRRVRDTLAYSERKLAEPSRTPADAGSDGSG
jgi:hypothetical protein